LGFLVVRCCLGRWFIFQWLVVSRRCTGFVRLRRRRCFRQLILWPFGRAVFTGYHRLVVFDDLAVAVFNAFNQVGLNQKAAIGKGGKSPAHGQWWHGGAAQRQGQIGRHVGRIKPEFEDMLAACADANLIQHTDGDQVA